MKEKPRAYQARRADDGDLPEIEQQPSRQRAHGGASHGEMFADMPIEEEPLPYNSLPAAVRKSIEEHLPGASRHDAVRMQLGEVTLFHVVAQRGRTGLAITVSKAGDLVEVERDIAPSRLPKAVKEALAAYYPDVHFTTAGTITMHFYEFEYEDERNNPRVVQIDASGRVLQDVDEANA